MERDPREAGQETQVCFFVCPLGLDLLLFCFSVCLLCSEAILHLLNHYPHKNLRFYNLHHSTPHGYPFCMYVYIYIYSQRTACGAALAPFQKAWADQGAPAIGEPPESWWVMNLSGMNRLQTLIYSLYMFTMFEMSSMSSRWMTLPSPFATLLGLEFLLSGLC